MSDDELYMIKDKHLIKIMLLGDAQSGKTALMSSFIDPEQLRSHGEMASDFSEVYLPPVCENTMKTISIDPVAMAGVMKDAKRSRKRSNTQGSNRSLGMLPRTNSSNLTLPGSSRTLVRDSSGSLGSFRGSFGGNKKLECILDIHDTQVGPSKKKQFRDARFVDRRHNYEGTNIFLLCAAVDDKDALLRIKDRWVQELYKEAPEVPYILVTTKLDIRDEHDRRDACRLAIEASLGRREFPQNVVKLLVAMINPKTGTKFNSQHAGMAAAGLINAKAFVECSAATGDGVDDVFQMAAITVLEQRGVLENYGSGSCCVQ